MTVPAERAEEARAAMAELFAEGRYTRVYTPGKAINYIPIVAGVAFH